jgi:uncharacterized membrane protein YeaQ/YmgE (transglycosylase-associated protein family)
MMCRYVVNIAFQVVGLDFALGMLIGAVTGAIADRLTQSKERHLSLNLLLGIAGAIVGMKVAEALEIPALWECRYPIAAALGGIFILAAPS